jgi:hypothetical protein
MNSNTPKSTAGVFSVDRNPKGSKHIADSTYGGSVNRLVKLIAHQAARQFFAEQSKDQVQSPSRRFSNTTQDKEKENG